MYQMLYELSVDNEISFGIFQQSPDGNSRPSSPGDRSSSSTRLYNVGKVAATDLPPVLCIHSEGTAITCSAKKCWSANANTYVIVIHLPLSSGHSKSTSTGVLFVMLDEEMCSINISVDDTKLATASHAHVASPAGLGSSIGERRG